MDRTAPTLFDCVASYDKLINADHYLVIGTVVTNPDAAQKGLRQVEGGASLHLETLHDALIFGDLLGELLRHQFDPEEASTFFLAFTHGIAQALHLKDLRGDDT